ncbi:MAG TPA: hypothetical protein P5207_08775, partial [Candidatus Sabulitectum sp.]|nr:hypothetical protein [Candidatus Sabulitectum sp.]
MASIAVEDLIEGPADEGRSILDDLPSPMIELFSLEGDDTAAMAVSEVTMSDIDTEPRVEWGQMLYRAQRKDTPFSLYIDGTAVRMLLQNYSLADSYSKTATSTFTGRKYHSGMSELPDINLNFIIPVKGVKHRAETVMKLMLVLGDPVSYDLVSVRVKFDAYGLSQEIPLLPMRLQMGYSVENMYCTLNIYGKLYDPVSD